MTRKRERDIKARFRDSETVSRSETGSNAVYYSSLLLVNRKTHNKGDSSPKQKEQCLNRSEYLGGNKRQIQEKPEQSTSMHVEGKGNLPYKGTARIRH